MKIGILGIGEIGKALHSLYEKHGIQSIKKDVNTKVDFNNLTVLNICIPYSKKFENIVINQIIESSAKLTIIHSTIPIGTTRNIKSILSHHIVHSPVIGSHPFLKESLETFTKFIGSPDPKAIKLTKDHYDKIKIDYQIFDSFESTEAAKLLCTSYYGICIAWHDYMKSVCEQNSLDFSIIKDWNMAYNDGYAKLNYSKYNRPILDPPKNKIGGHCVIPNAELLNTTNPSKLLQEILKFK